MRRIHPLYVVSALLVVATLVFLAIAGTGPAGQGRTGSVYDAGPGGAAALRRYVEAMGARTTTLQGSTFAPRDARVVLVLGASELITAEDAQRMRAFVRAGGTLVVATERGVFEQPLLDLYGVRVGGVAAPGRHPLLPVVFADPPASAVSVDQALTFVLPPGALALSRGATLAAAIADGRGVVVFVGSLLPFVAGGLADADNAHFVLDLVRPALAGATIAFDEYHHGFHPSTDVLILLEETWPGRALVFGTVVLLLYLILSGRRLGPPVPLDARPARSSLEYVRGFAGLVRRSGHGEIARRRLRADLHRGLARALGIDPATPFDRVVARVAATEPARAAEAVALDDALARPLRDDALLRTVAQIDRVVRTADQSETTRPKGGRT